MPQITIENLSLRFRGPMLLDDVSCQIDAGQRIGLLGRNGAGKTTLLRMLCGEVEPDHGQIQFAPHTQAALLPQDVPLDIHGSVRSVIHQGHRSYPLTDTDDLPEWQRDHKVDQLISRMQLDGDALFETLSSGMKRRVLLAQTLVSDPEVLLLDEPTNHLDLTAILWLEDFLSRWPATLIFITHDRTFLRTLATRILEIDRGRLFDWSCDYETFLKRKEAALEAEEKQNALFDKKLAEEEVWIRQGIKARRTRNEGRVRALQKMRLARRERRGDVGSVRMRIDQGQRSGNLVVKADRISFNYDDRPIVQDFSTTIMRGDKLGIIGPNGAGKTTLLRLLLGRLDPQKGQVQVGTNLQIAYFDQLREQLDEDRSVQENVGDGSDTISVAGGSKHVIGYLQDFLFTPERARSPVSMLSGGERNRVLLARLFAKPANVIILDEPTNDLDVETLEMLEERLVNYEGTLLVVSHDREFLNNVVTSTIAFEEGGAKEYAGGYDDWLRQRKEMAADRKESTSRSSASASGRPTMRPPRSPAAVEKRRLSFKEQQELSKLPETIERLETDISQLQDAMAQSDFYQLPGDRIAAERARLSELEQQLAVAFQRWEELDRTGE